MSRLTTLCRVYTWMVIVAPAVMFGGQEALLVEGTVTDESGAPVAGASVLLATHHTQANAVRGETDSHGRYRLAAPASDLTVVTIQAPGFAPRAVRVTVKPGLAPVDFKLQPARTLRALVWDLNKRPVPGASVSLHSFGEFHTLQWKTTTDAHGRFEWTQAPHEPVELIVTAEGMKTVQTSGLAAGDREHIIALSPALKVRGRVTDAATGEPVAGFRIIPGSAMSGLDALQSNPGAAQLFGAIPSAMWRLTEATDFTDGDYEIAVSRSSRDGHRIKVEALGYRPAVSDIIADEAPRAVHDFKLQRGDNLAGRVVDAHGQPVGGAAVVLATGVFPVQLVDGRLSAQAGQRSMRTDPEGRFTFPPQDEAWLLAVAEDAGYAQVRSESWREPYELTLAPWGRLEGVLWIGSTLGAHDRIWAYYQIEPGAAISPFTGGVIETFSPKTDEAGRFVIDRLRPGLLRIGRFAMHGASIGGAQVMQSVTVEPGKVTTVIVGGRGRAVIGRAVAAATDPPVTFEHMFNMLQREVDAQAIIDAAPVERSSLRSPTPFPVQPDGSFRIDDVPPGLYRLDLKVTEGKRAGRIEPIAVGHIKFEVTAAPAGQPLDLGEIQVLPVGWVTRGSVAPDFEIVTVDGRPWRLADHRGKYILLDFWATWCGPCLKETPNLKAVWEAFGQDERFVMIGLSSDKEPDAPWQYARRHTLGWTQGFVGEDAPVHRQYGIRGIPQIMLIGPDGKVIARDLRGEGILRAVQTALEH